MQCPYSTTEQGLVSPCLALSAELFTKPFNPPPQRCTEPPWPHPAPGPVATAPVRGHRQPQPARAWSHRRDGVGQKSGECMSQQEAAGAGGRGGAPACTHNPIYPNLDPKMQPGSLRAPPLLCKSKVQTLLLFPLLQATSFRGCHPGA